MPSNTASDSAASSESYDHTYELHEHPHLACCGERRSMQRGCMNPRMPYGFCSGSLELVMQGLLPGT
jgi:hypothetical protein